MLNELSLTFDWFINSKAPSQKRYQSEKEAKTNPMIADGAVWEHRARHSRTKQIKVAKLKLQQHDFLERDSFPSSRFDPSNRSLRYLV